MGLTALLAAALLSLSCAAPLESPAPTLMTALVKYDRVRLTAVPATGWFEGDIDLTNPDLTTVKQRMGKLFVPSYLPEGFTLKRVYVSGNWKASLHYMTSTCPQILLQIHMFTNGADFKFPQGTVEKVAVNGNTAYLVTGNWVGYLDNPVAWEESETLQLMFSLGGLVIDFQGSNAADWTADELIKIAESLHEL